MEHDFIIDKEPRSIKCEVKDKNVKATVDEERLEFNFSLPGENRMSLLNEANGYDIYYLKTRDAIHVFVRGEKYVVNIKDSGADFDVEAGGVGANGLIETPMPGTIIKFLVEEGERVEAEQGLVIVEAMKMENEIRSPIPAIVKKINFRPGDAVDIGQSIIDLEKIEEE